MKKRIVSIALVLALLLPVLVGAQPVHAETAPAIAVYVNGSWVAAQELTGSGETWIRVPIDRAVLRENDTNYVRITTNVASGTTQETQANLYFTNSTWSNSFLSPNWWVDDGWQAFSDKQANFYIAGWNGTEWKRIHDDIDTGYQTDSASVLGRNADNTYTNFARNIWIGANTLSKDSNYCIMIHMGLGQTLSTHPENAALFPTEHYHTCELCDLCGGCKASKCSLSHVKCACDAEHLCTFCAVCGRCEDADCGCEHEKCTGHAALRLRFNGQWYGIYVNDLRGKDKQWVSIPVSMEGLTTGQSYQLAASSNVTSGGNMDDTSIDFYATNATNGFESFLTNDRWCDGGWTGYSDRNVNLRLEGWNGHEWVDLNASGPSYSADLTTVLGQFSNDTWFHPCRNITLGDMTGITAMRVSAQLHVGKILNVQSDFTEASFATFPAPQEPKAHTMCSLHSESCAVIGCKYNTCASLSHCAACAICGKCEETDCGYAHEKCAMDPNAALRVRVNQQWYGLNISELTGTRWVYVPVDITKLNQNGENYLSISSNISSRSELSAHSLDILFTATEESDSFVTDHRWCDENWKALSDRNINMMLQLYDGTQWINAKEEHCENELHTMLGLSQTEETWYNYSRTLALSDLTQYSAARVAVQVHVGERLDVIADYKEEEFATFLNTGLAENEPSNDEGNRVIVHTLKAAAPSAPTAGTTAGRENAHLRVRFNNVWYEALLDGVKTDQDGMAWVTVNVPVSQIRANAENQVLLSSDVNSAAAYSGSSVDVYATGTAGANSFVNVNDYFDDWTRNETAEWNIRLEVSRDGETWESLTGTHPTYCDTSYQLGRRSDGTKSHAAKNLFLGEIPDYQHARIAVQVHIGTNLAVQNSTHVSDDSVAPVSHNTSVLDENPSVHDVQDNEDVKLRIRVNGVWFETSLQEYKGQAAVWIPVEIDLSALRGGEENYFHVSTTVVSYGSRTPNSVDLYYSNANRDLNSFLCADEYCDNGWIRYNDRNFNIRLELFDGSKWVTVAPQETTYYDGSVPIGYLGEQNDWSNAARNLVVGSLDGYSAARVLVELHVGAVLAGLDDGDIANDTLPTFDRTPDVGKPPYAEVKPMNPADTDQTQSGDDAAEQTPSGQMWLWILLGGAAVVIAACVLLACLKRKAKSGKR